jgi:hypothetical protein
LIQMEIQDSGIETSGKGERKFPKDR